MSSSSVEVAREAFRERRIGPRYSGPLHLATTTSVSLLVALASALMLDDVRPLEWLTIPLTFLYANLSEYLGHRGPMHHKTRFLTKVFERHSIEHHSFFTHEAATFDSSRDYKAVLFPPILLIFFIAGFAVPVGALLYVLLSPNVCFLFVLTAVLYFLNYELLHFAYHCKEDSWLGRLPLISQLRQHHVTHHNRQLMTRYNFNITYPICDRLFGTLYREDARS
ncbi:MAG: sterol desaturase family protein [Woeseiaceae bacterium]|nr:sterol desaturase family protein [Woeseiaceae bacterium]